MVESSDSDNVLKIDTNDLKINLTKYLTKKSW